MLSQSTDPHLPMLARVCGRALLLAYVLSVLSLLIPPSPLSTAWGSQLSSRILDGASLPLVGVALLRYASLAEPIPDPLSEPQEAMQVARRRDNAVGLCRLGVISLSLLAMWQFALLTGSLAALDQRSSSQSTVVSQRLRQAERSISRAPAVLIEREWKRFVAAGAPGSNTAVNGTEQKREALLQSLRKEQQQVGLGLSQQRNNARFSLVRERLRNLGLCLIYVLSFQAMGRRLS